jgi:hypothetical protein
MGCDRSQIAVDVLIVINAINSLGNGKPMVFGGLTPASDPNNNGIVLANNVTIQGQTLANSLVTVSLDRSNSKQLSSTVWKNSTLLKRLRTTVLHWGNDQRTIDSEVADDFRSELRHV